MKRKLSFMKRSYMIIIILCVYIFSLSIGYAFFSESLTINGVASTVEYYEGNKLPVTAVLRDTTNNYYFTSNFDQGYLLSLEKETWQDDTYTLELDKSLLKSLEGKGITYTISFTNPTTLNYTNGMISTESVDSNSDIAVTSGTLSQTEVFPGGSTDISFYIKADNFNSSDSIAKATIMYTYQNKPRYLYFVVKYNAMPTYENLFSDELLLSPNSSGSVIKTDDGYNVNKYPAIYLKDSHPLFKELLDNLKPGVKYMIIRDYQGDMSVSNGMINLRNKDEVIVRSPYGIGVKSVTFSLTQEQIDSIDRMYIYGHATGKNTFRFIQLRQVN